MTIRIDPVKLAALKDRWSDISPEEGTEECICMVCGKIIGACEEDPRWEEHDAEWCTGCELCELAIRVFHEDHTRISPGEKSCVQIGLTGAIRDPTLIGEVKEMRFHPRCFETLL
jgi:hypothetical protein